MRRGDQAVLIRFQPGPRLERRHRLGARRGIQKQYMPAFDRLLDTANQYDTPRCGRSGQRRNIELLVVQRNRKSAIAQARSSVDELECRMPDAVDRIVRRMAVEFDFQSHDREKTNTLGWSNRRNVSSAPSSTMSCPNRDGYTLNVFTRRKP